MPGFRPDIQQVLDMRTGVPLFGVRDVLRQLPEHVPGNETVEDLVVGEHDDRSSVLALTSSHVLLLTDEAGSGEPMRVDDVPLRRVTDVVVEQRGTGSVIRLRSGRDVLELKAFAASHADPFVAAVRQRVDQVPAAAR